MAYDLDDSVVQFGKMYSWTLRRAVEGVQIFGGIGSGKTSGSGRTLAINYLKRGFGGLVLSVKHDELDIWKEYCRLTGREDDLIIVNPENDYRFNFLDYEMNRQGKGSGITQNLVNLLKTVIHANESKKSTMASGDAFWENALDMLMHNLIDLCQLAYEKITLQDLLLIAQSIPNDSEELNKSETWLNTKFGDALLEIRKKRKFSNDFDDKKMFQYISIENYLLDNLINLSSKTRSIIEHSFTGLLHQLNRDPIYSLFCSGNTNFTPEDCITKGKIIFIDLPVKTFDKVGQNVQILFKYIWQRAMERRDVKENDRPVFLWADEAQNFIHEHDIDYQATARSARVCTVYLTQNLPNYFAHLGGETGKYHIYSFLGTLSTKIFHANTEKETNEYASNLIGKSIHLKKSESKNINSAGYSKTEGTSEDIDFIIPPEQFNMLLTGGKLNRYLVEGIIHCQEAPWKNDGLPYYKTFFNQQKNS